MDFFFATVDVFGIIQKFEFPAGKLPVWFPSSHHYPALFSNGIGQLGDHGDFAAFNQLIIIQAVFAHGLAGLFHDTGFRIDTDDSAIELIRIFFQILDRNGLYVRLIALPG